ncbi:MAG: DUF2314 domain-containing protein [Pirellulaceae bacterium]
MTVGCDPHNEQSNIAVTTNKEPLPVQVAPDGARMTAAIEQSRATVEKFIAALMDPKPNQKAFSVKTAIKDGDQVEHLWLVPVRYEDGKFIGRVSNEPHAVKTVRVGDTITVAKREISDWVYAEDRKMIGGFTVKAMQDSSNVNKGPVGNRELIGTWSVVSIDVGAGADPKSGFQLEVTKTAIRFVAPNGSTKTMGQIHRIDPTATPCEIDLQNNGLIGLGIYELDGDSLKLIVRSPGAERPKELKGSSNGMLFTLRRD